MLVHPLGFRFRPPNAALPHLSPSHRLSLWCPPSKAPLANLNQAAAWLHSVSCPPPISPYQPHSPAITPALFPLRTSKTACTDLQQSPATHCWSPSSCEPWRTHPESITIWSPKRAALSQRFPASFALYHTVYFIINSIRRATSLPAQRSSHQKPQNRHHRLSEGT